jgi:hypothetical protein
MEWNGNGALFPFRILGGKAGFRPVFEPGSSRIRVTSITAVLTCWLSDMILINFKDIK